MRDQLVRQAFHQIVLKDAHKDENTFVVDELGLKNGEIRADIAVINGKLVGYEIKTERDTLKRLPSQVDAYNEVFHEAFIILSRNHLNKALEYIPYWWGVYTIEPLPDEKFTFLRYREARYNKQQNTYTLSQLLWKEEALQIVNELLYQNVKYSTSKREIYQIISRACPKRKLSKIVIGYLKKRVNWRTDQLPLLRNDD